MFTIRNLSMLLLSQDNKSPEKNIAICGVNEFFYHDPAGRRQIT